MPGRIAGFMFGVVAYLTFCGAFLYAIGFVGTLQAGKSTILNGILGANGPDAPALEGVGVPTTGLVTRLHAKTTPGHALCVRYFTREQYLARRNAICDRLNLANSASKTEEEILAELEATLPIAAE